MESFQATIIRFESLTSTNTEAATRAAQGATQGLCIVAREQTRGRGRLQRTWVSPAGAGLYFSLLLRPRVDAGVWSLLPLMAALAVADTLDEAFELKVDVKWPNDILVHGRKLCGILVETIETNLGRAVILGIGINLTTAAFPPDLDRIATSLQEATGVSPDADALLQSLLGTLSNRYELWQTAGGADAIRDEWQKHSSYAQGKRVRVVNGSEIVEGTTRGLESDGALRVETDAGEIKVMRAGDVTSVRSQNRLR